MTERLLVDAGIGPGMRVLDAGCGSGDVAVMLAALVGPNGRVVGVDRDARSLEVARERARALGLSHVEFLEMALDALSLNEQFDAVVGRRVLMYQPDAIETLLRVARVLRAGGLAVFQEHDSTAVPGLQESLPLHWRVRSWIWDTVAREGADVHMGFGLATALAQAGFVVEGLRAEAVVVSPTIAHPAAAIVRAMRPRIVGHGVATEHEIDLESLEQRLTAERISANTTAVWELIFGVWARKAGAPCA